MPIRQFSFSLLLCLLACQSSSSFDENSAEAAAVSEVAERTVSAVAVPPDRQQAHISHIQRLQTEMNEREKSGDLTVVPAPLTGVVNAEVLFAEGMVRAVRWNDDQAGINALRTCFYEEGRIVFATIDDHGNDWYRRNYSYSDPEMGCVPYIIQGDFGEETEPEISFDDLVTTFACDYPTDYLATKIYQAALRQADDGQRFFQGKLGGNLAIHLKWTQTGERLMGAYHYENKPQELALDGYQVRDSVWLTERWEGETTGYFEGVRTADGGLKGHWCNADRSKKMPVNLQRQAFYLEPDGQKTYQQVFIHSENTWIRIHDEALPAADFRYLRDNQGFQTTTAVQPGDNDFRALYDYFEYAMTNTLTPDAVPREDPYPNPVFNYFYFIQLHQPDFVPEKERNDGYYSDLAPKFDMRHRLFAYLIKHTDRSAGTISSLFQHYGSLIYGRIPTQVFNDMQIGPYLDELIASYDTLATYPDYEVKLAGVYRQLDSLDAARLSKPHTTYGRVDDNERNACFRAFHHARGGADHIPQLDFWARRQHEGNLRTVYGIIREIRAGYANGLGDEEGH